MCKRSRLGPLSRLPRKSGVRRFKSLVSWDCWISRRYITRQRLYTRSNLRHLHRVYGVSGTKRATATKRIQRGQRTLFKTFACVEEDAEINMHREQAYRELTSRFQRFHRAVANGAEIKEIIASRIACTRVESFSQRNIMKEIA